MGNLNDPNNDKARLQKRLEEVKQLPTKEQDLVDFWITNELNKKAESTQERHIANLLTVRGQLGIDEDEDSEEAEDEDSEEAEDDDEAEQSHIPLHVADKFVWSKAISNLAKKRGWTDGTKRNYEKAVRSFIGALEEDLPVSRHEIGLSKDDSGGKIGEEDVLTLEEARILISEASTRLRDKAMIGTAIDLGLRVSALCSLRVKDFKYERGNPVAELSLNEEALGQKGSEGRTQVATFSSGYVNNYLRNEHPRPDDPGAPLFHKSRGQWDAENPDDDGSISPAIFRRRMKRLARDTDIDKDKLHPHNLKHAAVTIWAIRGLSIREIEHRAGWSRESGQLDRYEHITDDQVNTQILDTFGIDWEGNDVLIEPIETCPHCGISVDSAVKFCPNCGQQIAQIAWPDWFEDYLEMYGEDDGLVVALQASPTTITADPRDLPEQLRSRYQDRIAHVIGDTLTTRAVPEEIQIQLPNEDGEEVIVSVPRDADFDFVEAASIQTTRDGYQEVLNDKGDVIYRIDPIMIDT